MAIPSVFPPTWHILRPPQTDSTSRHLRELAAAGAPSGTVVIAENQTAGHGRLGRTWLAPPGALLLSALIRPPAPLPLLSLAAGVAAAEAADLPGLTLKWPNDLLIGPDKCGGILVEGRWQGPVPEFLIVGIGVNVTEPPALSGTTCLKAAGYAHAADTLAAAFLDRLGIWSTVSLREPERLIEGWSSRCGHWDQPVTVQGTATPWTGMARGLAPDGSLIVECPDGRHVHLQSGEVRLTAEGARTPLV